MGSSGKFLGSVCITQRGVGQCSIREHSIDTQRLPPYRMTLGQLFY
jgi:hypothetical protein